MNFFPIDSNSYRSVSGFNSRVRFLIMHYTAVDFAGSIAALSGKGKVSAHYLVPDPAEKTYIEAGFETMRCFNLVDEADRAWHAGVSAWGNRTNLNDCSIGIENVNLASESAGQYIFPPYNEIQIAALIQLAANIVQRYPDITPTNILGHSDIAVGRKTDPGPAFPWKRLYDAGIGAWYDEVTKAKYLKQFAEALPAQNDIISQLKRYGYATEGAKTDQGYRALIRAFQLHFRPENCNGQLDPETAAVLYALVDKYG